MFTKRHLVELIFLHVATLYSSNHLEAHGKLFRFVHQRLHEIKHVLTRHLIEIIFLNVVTFPSSNQLEAHGTIHLVELIFLHVVTFHNSNQLEAHGDCWFEGLFVGW